MSIDDVAALLAESDHLITGRDLPPVPSELDPYDPRRIAWRGAAWPDASRLYKALVLAPSLEACRALLAGESVPIERLDPVGVARLGRRPR